MASTLKPLRRVVTGNDERGRSKVTWDGPAPNAHESSMGSGRGHTDLWVWNDTPPSLSGAGDDGSLSYEFPCPPNGGHLRVVQGRSRPADYDASKDRDVIAPHPPKARHEGARVWDRGGNSLFSSAFHKTQTIDYGILIGGERQLILDDCTLTMRPGDIVVQVGAWHQWSNAKEGALMVFDMFAARFVDGAAGLAQGNDQPMKRGAKLPDGMTATRRIVTIDREEGKGSLVSDGPAPDVRFDPARPGFALERLWVTDEHPAKIAYESLQNPHTLVPPAGGTVCNVLTLPPEESWKGKVGAAEVKAYFASVGAPAASTYSPLAPHPYMQKTSTLDFCIVLEGDAVLVLDTQEVAVSAGDIVIQRGTSHAWGNRSGRPARIAICSHDAKS
jgi:uncharacterized cupin superfamily protein